MSFALPLSAQKWHYWKRTYHHQGLLLSRNLQHLKPMLQLSSSAAHRAVFAQSAQVSDAPAACARRLDPLVLQVVAVRIENKMPCWHFALPSPELHALQQLQPPPKLLQVRTHPKGLNYG
jgi:hypothetical protein